MWVFIFRKLLYNIPVYLAIILLMMAALRVNDPVTAFQGKNASLEQIESLRKEMDLNRPLFLDVQFWRGPWQQKTGGEGGSYLTRKGADSGRFSISFNATLEPGEYRLQASWPSIDKGTRSVHLHIYDDLSRLRSVTVDQSKPIQNAQGEDSQWQDLGSFTFKKNKQRIVITNKADGWIVADAVRFIPVDADASAQPVTLFTTDSTTLIKGNRWTPGRFFNSIYNNQYISFLGRTLTLNFTETSWSQKGRPVKDILFKAIPPSMSITIPTLFTSAMIAIVIGLISAYYRGRSVDRTLVIIAVLGMSVSYLVYIIFGQFFGAALPANSPFAIEGYENWFGVKKGPGGESTGLFLSISTWVTYCMLPVMVGVIVSLGYDTRFYRAVMVEECNKDYIVTATAKGSSQHKIMFVHMLKNAMIPIITRIMSTLPFLITGSILLEMYFNIPGMGRELIMALNAYDFPVIQAFVAVLAAIFILTIILTDVLYALVDPRVRLS